MSDSTRIEEIISQSALKGFDELNAKVNASVQNIERLITASVQTNSALANIKSPKAFNAAIREIDKSEKELIATTTELSATQQQLDNRAALLKQKEAINELIIKNKELSNAIKEQELTRAKATAADRLASKEGKEVAAAEKAKLQEELAAGREKILQKRKEVEEQQRLNAELIKEQEIPTGFVNKRAQLVKEPLPQTAAFIPSTELEQSIHLLQRQELALQQNQAAQKQLTKDLQSGKISQAEYDAEINKAIQKEIEFKSSIAATSAELKRQAAIDISPEGTLARAKAENKQLSAQRDLVDPSDIAEIKQLNDQIDKNNELIDANSAKLEKQKINIGNYPNLFTKAFDTLQTEIVQVDRQIKSGVFTGKDLEKLTVKQVALKNATSLVTQEFASAGAQSKAYQQAALQIGQAYGTNSTVFKEFAKHVGQGTVEVNNVSTAVTKASAGGNKLVGAFKNIGASVVSIARILPGIGIIGIISLASDAIISLVSGFFDANKKIETFKENLKNVNDIVAEGNKTAGKQLADLKILSAAAEDVNLNMETRLNAVRKLKTEFPEHLENISQEAILNGRAGESYRSLTADIIANSRALAAKVKIDELEAQKLDILFQKQKIQNATDAEKARAKGQTKATLTDAEGVARVRLTDADVEAIAAKKREIIEQRRLKAFRAQQLKEDSLNQQEKFLLNFVGQKNIETAVTRETTKAVKERQEIVKAIKQDFSDKELNEEIAGLKTISRNEAFYFTDRINKRKEAFEIENELVRRQKEIAIRNEQDKLNAVKDVEGRRGKDGSKVAVLNAENEFAAAIKKINADTGYDVKKLVKEAAEDVQRIRNESNLKQLEDDMRFHKEFIAQSDAAIEARKKAEKDSIIGNFEDRTRELQRGRDIEIRVIEETKNEKLKAAETEGERQKIEEKYQKKRLKVELETDILILKASLETQEELLKIASDPKTAAVLGAKISELKKQIAELQGKTVKIDIDADVSKINEVVKAFDKIREVAGSVFDLVGGAINAYVTAQKNALQDQSDEIERNSAAEVAAINASTDTAEKKAAKLQAIESSTAAQKEIIAQRQRQLDQKNAEFAKARAIAEIILNTAVAVSKVAATLPLAIATAAFGAAQLAIAIATPVPRFEKGTMDAPGGLAYIGEKRRELIIKPDGSMIETPGTPVVMNVPKHSVIIPDSRKVMESGIGKRQLVNVKVNENGEMFYMLGGKLEKLGKIIKNKTETHIHRKGDGWEQIKKSGNNQTRYLN